MGEEFEITVPLNHQFRDFAARMGDALQVLEAFEARSQIQIFQDLLVTGADVIRLRLADAELADASVPLDEGAALIQKAKDMVLAAACAAVNPRTYYPSRKSGRRWYYIRKTDRHHRSSPVMISARIVPPVIGRRARRVVFSDPTPMFADVLGRIMCKVVPISAVSSAIEDAARRCMRSWSRGTEGQQFEFEIRVVKNGGRPRTWEGDDPSDYVTTSHARSRDIT